MSAGAIFVAFGVAFLAASVQFEIGSARQMGPGYFPFVLSVLLVVLGVSQIHVASAFRRTSARPALFVLGGLAVFAATLEPLGLVLATVLLVAIAGVVAQGRRWIEVGVPAAGLAGFSTVVFVRLLGLPIPVWPGGW